MHGRQGSVCLFGRTAGLAGLPGGDGDAFEDRLSRGHAAARLAACYALADLQDAGAVEHLLRALADDRQGEVRMAAAYALGWLRDVRAVPQLIRTLGDVREDGEVRGMAAEQLGRLEDPAAVPELRRALRDERPEVRFWAAYALGCIAPDEAIDDLVALAGSDTAAVPGQDTVRQEALEAIDSIRGRRRAGP